MAAAAGSAGIKARFYQVVLDTTAAFWGPHEAAGREPSVAAVMDALYVLINATLSTTGDVRFQFLVADERGSAVVYPNEASLSGDVGDSVVENLRRHLPEVVARRARAAEAAGSTPDTGPQVSSAVSRALCLVSKGCLAASPNAAQAMGLSLDKGAVDARILVVQGGGDVGRQYNSMMNAIFSAAKLGVVIDGLSLGSTEPAMLQQACFLTGGCFHQMDAASPEPPLLVLFTVFAPDVATRRVLRMPPMQTVDFRASCICHMRPVDQALVCPVCLSIFCDDSNEAETGVCRVCGLGQRRGDDVEATAANAIANGS